MRAKLPRTISANRRIEISGAAITAAPFLACHEVEMATPAINTKVELVVEAVEDLVVAAASKNHDAVVEARKNAADALRNFLSPALRLATNNGQQVG